MAEVESPVPARAIVLPYALWPQREALTNLELPALPALRDWCAQARVSAVALELNSTPEQPSLSMPHEWVAAAQLGWPLVDGLLPWAAQAAVHAGLAQVGDASAWGFVSLCHWQISHGLATLSDPADVPIDEATDAALFAAMQPFFAEDGLALHRYLPGVWLVQSTGLATLPTASLERVIGDDVDAWLVSGAQASLWRRLQNEMQMLLYTHPVNAQRAVPLNSFWLHGTGALPSNAHVTTPQALDGVSANLTSALHDLRRAYLAQHLPGWCQAWQAVLKALTLTNASPTSLVLCGVHACRVYQTESTQMRSMPKPWHALQTFFHRALRGKPSLADVLSEPQQSESAHNDTQRQRG